MDEVPFAPAMLEASPMAVSPDFSGWAVEIEVKESGSILLDPSLKCGVGRLIGARVFISVERPAALLPVRNLAARDRRSGALPPRDPFKKTRKSGGGRPNTEVFYAHPTGTPTSAFVDAKIFSPSLNV